MRKGQIESGEMIMVMLIVMLFLILGFVGYSNFKKASIDDTAQDIESLESVELAQEAAGMIELSCGLSKEETGLCLDTYKLQALGGLIEKAEVNSPVFNYYRSQYGQSLIIVEQIYPAGLDPWVIYNNTPEDVVSATPLRIPVQIYNPVEKKNAFGIMTVVKYS